MIAHVIIYIQYERGNQFRVPDKYIEICPFPVYILSLMLGDLYGMGYCILVIPVILYYNYYTDNMQYNMVL